MDGLTNADRISDLQRRLKELPIDLEQYFLHILTSLDSFYLHQASQLFRLALEARKPLSVQTFSYLDEDDPDFALKRKIKSISEEEEAARYETIERRLNSRCKGPRAYWSLAVARAATNIPIQTVWWRSESPTRSLPILTHAEICRDIRIAIG